MFVNNLPGISIRCRAIRSSVARGTAWLCHGDRTSTLRLGWRDDVHPEALGTGILRLQIRKQVVNEFSPSTHCLYSFPLCRLRASPVPLANYASGLGLAQQLSSLAIFVPRKTTN
jgi:hypothetical protein